MLYVCSDEIQGKSNAFIKRIKSGLIVVPTAAEHPQYYIYNYYFSIIYSNVIFYCTEVIIDNTNIK